MDEIPLADVITAQPTTPTSAGRRDGAGGASNQQPSSEPVLTGTGPLKSTDTLLVKQRIRACEILSLCTLCEVGTHVIDTFNPRLYHSGYLEMLVYKVTSCGQASHVF